MLGLPTSRVRELAREALVRSPPDRRARSTPSGAASSPTTCSASRAAPRPRPPGATCGGPSPPAPGRARCSTRWTSSTTRPTCPPSPRASRRAAPRRQRKPKAERKPKAKREPKEKRDRKSIGGRLADMDTFARRRLLGGIGLAAVALFVVLVPAGGRTHRRRRIHAQAQEGQQRRRADHRPAGVAPCRRDQLQGRRRGRGGRARRPAPADRAGPADPQQEPPGLRGLAVQLEGRREVAGRPGDRPERHLPGCGPATEGLPAVQVLRRVRGERGPRTASTREPRCCGASSTSSSRHHRTPRTARRRPRARRRSKRRRRRRPASRRRQA